MGSWLENTYSALNFCGKNVCGNFYLEEVIFAGIVKKNHESQKLKPAKTPYHTEDTFFKDGFN